MRRFADLYDRLDRTTSTNDKVAALAAYFGAAPAEDAAWAVFFLTGRRLKRFLSARLLAGWALEEVGISDWLFTECYAGVGDTAETIALVLDGAFGAEKESGASDDLPLSLWMSERLLPLRDLPPEEQRQRVLGWWRGRDRQETYVLCKLLTGELRVGVSQTLVERALARLAEIPPQVVAHRLMGTWEPDAPFFLSLIAPEVEGGGEDRSRPYPFYLASPLDPFPPSADAVAELEQRLGARSDWRVEWKWDGIRAQLLRRAGAAYLWSRGEELIGERFPELVRGALSLLPDGTAIDGEILTFRDGRPLPFSTLQRRIGRKLLTEKVLSEAPVVLMAYDLLEVDGVDVRDQPLELRQGRLAELVAAGRPIFLLSPQVAGDGWQEIAVARQEARERGVEGLMIKRLDSPYRAGRKRGDWWKWKIEPWSVDAVLVYAQAGHGRRANLFTDYTFAVWSEGELVPIAKAYSGLSDEEILKLDGWIRAHTLQKFGPVRSVEPLQVFELAFEGIARSPRHRSGIAVRFPRIARWRSDKTPEQADTLEQIQELLPPLKK